VQIVIFLHGSKGSPNCSWAHYDVTAPVDESTRVAVPTTRRAASPLPLIDA